MPALHRNHSATIYLLVCLLLAACAPRPQPPAVATQTPVIPPPAVPTATVPPPTPIPRRPSPSATPPRHLPAETDVPGKIISKKATATQPGTPQVQPTIVHSRLEAPDPTLAELNRYLQEYYPDFPGFYETTQFELIDLSGDGSPDQVSDYGDPPPVERRLVLVHQDINGDAAPDLIVAGFKGLAVLAWTDDHFAEPLLLEIGETRYGWPWVEVAFTDWTADGAPELIFDQTDYSNCGTGEWCEKIYRQVIHCAGARCWVVWYDTIFSVTSDSNLGGYARFELDIHPGLTAAGFPALRVTDSGFTIYCCRDDASGIMPTDLNVYIRPR